MAESYYPFDGGQQVIEQQWGDMAHLFAQSGVDAAPNATLTAIDPVPLALTRTSGLSWSLGPGGAWVNGFYYKNGGTVVKTHDAADPTFSRNDLIVLRLDRPSKSIYPFILKGSPQATPIDPVLTRTDALYDLPLHRALVRASNGTFAATDIVDLRTSAYSYVPPPTFGTTFPVGAQPGARFYRTDLSRSYTWSGTTWCVTPGQTLLWQFFSDNAGYSYHSAVRIGARGGSDAIANFDVPEVLPGQGLEFVARALPLSSQVTIGDAINLYWARYISGSAGASTQQFLGRRIADARYGAPFNATVEAVTRYQRGDANITPGLAVHTVNGSCGTGILQFVDGLMWIKS